MSTEVGSRWYKFDFHTHTPASSDYKQSSLSETEWLKKLMEKSVDCVAVTDHVSGDWVDRLKAIYQELDQNEDWFRPLHIFPGCEITVSTAQARVHILAIFNPDCKASKITAILGQCGVVEGHGDAEITCATSSVENVIDIIHNADGIAIPAHIDGSKGLLEGVNNTNQEIEKWLQKINAAEAINLKFLDDVDHELRQAASHLALVRGSDAHEIDQLGRRYSWVKMSTPSIEGLKLALHDHSFCIENETDDPNSTPELYLSNLKISKMNHCGRIPGQPAEFHLHPLFNAIIGGRGSGKSTFIESLRLALGRVSEVDELPNVKKDVESFKDEVTNNETQITAELQRREEQYQAVWKSDTGSVIKKIVEGHWQEDNGRPEERFHVSLYSQKQINALAMNANSLLDIIDRSSQVGYSSWKRTFDANLMRFLNLCRELRQLRSHVNSRSALQAELDDINSDIHSFEQGGYQKLFFDYQTLSTERKKIIESADVSKLKRAIDDLLTNDVQILSLVSDVCEKPEYVLELENIQNTFNKSLAKVKDNLLSVKQDIEKAEKIRNKAITESQWNTLGQKTREDYSAVVEEYREKGEKFDPAEYERWLERRNELVGSIADLDKTQILLDEKEEESNQSLRSLYSMRRRLQRKRQKFINDVIGESPYVKMKLIPFSSKESVEKQFRGHIGVESRFESSIYQAEVESSLLFDLLSSDLTHKDIIKETQKIKQAILGKYSKAGT